LIMRMKRLLLSGTKATDSIWLHWRSFCQVLYRWSLKMKLSFEISRFKILLVALLLEYFDKSLSRRKLGFGYAFRRSVEQVLWPLELSLVPVVDIRFSFVYYCLYYKSRNRFVLKSLQQKACCIGLRSFLFSERITFIFSQVVLVNVDRSTWILLSARLGRFDCLWIDAFPFDSVKTIPCFRY
jgi:hypothetical protein